MTDLEARIYAVEREVAGLRRSRRFAWGACGLAVAVALFAGASPAITQEAGTTLKAPLRVVTSGGKPVMTVGSDSDGPFIHLFGANGNPTMLLWSDKDGGNLVIQNSAGKNVGEMVSAEHGGHLRVYDKEGRRQVSMFPRDDGSGGNFAIFNRAGKSVIAAFARSGDFGGNLVVYDRDAREAGTIFARPEGGGVLQVYDAKQKVIFKQPD